MELSASRTYIVVEVRDEETFGAIDWQGGERPHWWTSFPTTATRGPWPDSAEHVVWNAGWTDRRRSQTFYDLDQALWHLSPSVEDGERFEFENAFRELFLKAPIQATVTPGTLDPRSGRKSLDLPTSQAVAVGEFRMDAINCFEAARYATERLADTQRWLKAYQAETEDFVLTFANQVARRLEAEGHEPGMGYQYFDPSHAAYLGLSPAELLTISRRGGGHYYAREMAEAVDHSNRGLRVERERERRWQEAVDREFKWQLGRVQKSYFVPRTADEHEALRLHRVIITVPRGTAARLAAEKERDDFIRERLAQPELAGSIYEEAYRTVAAEGPHE